ncbi:MAG TPA: beta-propeller domain-containing protein [Labilithrix sp.]
MAALGSTLAGCGGSGNPGGTDREEGQTDYTSAPPAGQGGGGSSSGGAGGAAPTANAGDKSASPTFAPDQRSIAETDIYRLDGNRLYYLNAYRGLMVFDVTNVDAPVLLGRSPVFGTPVEMYVKDGTATVVIGDWYSTAADGTPFHGSVVRALDASDPTNIKVTGEVQIKGWARDMRIVSSTLLGDNLYIVSEDYGWYYGMWGGWYGPYGGGGDAVGVASPAGGGADACYGCYGGGNSKVVISSVNLKGGSVALKGVKEFDGYGGAFNVTANAILMAHDVKDSSTMQPTGKVELDYIDISSNAGDIVSRGSIQVDGLIEGWSADNGRWNIDFDGKTASAIGCSTSDYGYCNGNADYVLSTVDFTNPDAPAKLAALPITNSGWAATARFANGRMYLSPREGYYSNGSSTATPVQIFDLSAPAAPKLAGSTNITGAVWMFLPVDATRVFALGNDYGPGYSSNSVSLRYLDVTDPTKPSVLGTSSFGDGWAWTPAADTFKAFVRDDTQKLIVLPFSGWSNTSYEYTNGVQLVEYDANTITTRGAAKGDGWVERGIFVNNRIISLSDQALSVVDYSDRNNPKVVNKMTLARNVVSAQPDGATIAQLSTDWWGYDQQNSELRVLPIGNAEELHTDPAAKSVTLDGTDAQVFRNGDLAYVLTTKYPKPPYNGPYYETPEVQVVDLANGGATLRGKIDLPQLDNYYWNWWGGFYYYDWYDGAGTVQVGKDALAFRRVHGEYNQYTGKYTVESNIFIVDLSNPDAPQISSTAVTPDSDDWWGNMRVVGDTLYLSHYEWVEKPNYKDPTKTQYFVKYFLDQVDLTNRAAPTIGKRINVPGILVGASETDNSILYFVDYRWYDNTTEKDELAVAQIKDDKAYFRSSTPIEGWMGNVFVRGNTAYFSAEDYVQNPDPSQSGQSFVKLHQVDITDPKHPVDNVSSPKDGWGWLVGVEGDRAIITSGWGQVGLDIYKLTPGAAPTYDQFARTRGWWWNAITRQDNDLYLASGYWGVQKVHLQ